MEDTESIESIRSRRSINLLNIVKKLKKNKKTSLPDISIDLDPTDVELTPKTDLGVPDEMDYFKQKEIKPSTSTSLVIDSLRSVNYAPIGYKVWNHYYEEPEQKYPNSVLVKVKSGSFLETTEHMVLGFIIKEGVNYYKLSVDDMVKIVNEESIVLSDASNETFLNDIHLDNIKFHNENLPKTSLKSLDYLLWDKHIDEITTKYDKESKYSDEELESKSSDLDINNTVIIAVHKSKNLFGNKFKYRRWKLYAQNYNSGHLEYYQSLLVEKELDRLYESGYIRFGYGFINKKPSLLPIENVEMNEFNSINYIKQIDYLKTTKPQSIKQIGGGSEPFKVISLGDGFVDEKLLDLLKTYREFDDDADLYKMYKYYQPFPNREFSAPVKLLVKTDVEVFGDNDFILGKYTFIDVENYGGFIYKKSDDTETIIIKCCYDKPINKIEVLPEITIEQDGFGNLEDNPYCYWFICKKSDDNIWEPLYFTEILNNKISSIPLVKKWFPIDLMKLENRVNYEQIDVVEDITDSERIVEHIKNNRFIMFPWDFSEGNKHKDSIDINSWVRIIKDYEYNGYNLRYLVGKVTSFYLNKEDEKVYVIKLEFPFPYDEEIDSIEFLENFIELLDFNNSLIPYFNYLYNNQEYLKDEEIEPSVHYQSRMLNRITSNLTSKEVDSYYLNDLNNSKFRLCLNYLKNMVLSPDSIITPFIKKISGDEINFGLKINHEFLKIDPYYKPTVKSHILSNILKLCKQISTNSYLSSKYNCTISDNWPPKEGDKVYIMEGLYKGEIAKITEIITKTDYGNNGEAVVEIINNFDLNKAHMGNKVWKLQPAKKLDKGGKNVSNYRITMNYLLPYVENDKLDTETTSIISDTKQTRYPGYMLLDIIFSKSINNLAAVEYLEPVSINYGNNWSNVNYGDYYLITKGEFKGLVAVSVNDRVNKIEYAEKIEQQNYRDVEKAGDEIIFNDDTEGVIRLGVQQIISVKLANDLYKLLDEKINRNVLMKVEDNTNVIKLIYSNNSLVSECEKLDSREAAIAKIKDENMVGGKTNLNPLIALGNLLKKNKNKIKKNKLKARRKIKRKTLF